MTLISTRDLSALPEVGTLRELLRSLAMLDAILCRDWDGRHFSFDAHWGRGETLGSLRNGQGDHFFALFNDYGCFLKGFVHDSPAAAAPLPAAEHYRDLPPALAPCLHEPAFATQEVTFCIWRSFTDAAWTHHSHPWPPGDDPDGSAYLLFRLDGNPETYRQWAEDYYEHDVDLKAVQAIYARSTLTADLLRSLNPERKLSELREDLRAIGYPV